MMRACICLLLGAFCLWSNVLADYSSADFRAFDEDDGDWGLPRERRPEGKPFPLYNEPLTPEEDAKFTEEYEARQKMILERVRKANEKRTQPPMSAEETYCSDMLFVRSRDYDDASGAALAAHHCLEYYRKLKYEELPEWVKEYIPKPTQSSTTVPDSQTTPPVTPDKDSHDEKHEGALKPNTVSSPYPPTPAKPPQRSYDITQDYTHVDVASK